MLAEVGADVPAQGRDRDRDGPAQRARSSRWPTGRAIDANDLGARARLRRARTAPSASTYEPGSTFKAFTVAGALAGRRRHARHAVQPAAADPGRRPHDRRAHARGDETLDDRRRSSRSRATSARSRSACGCGAAALRQVGAPLRLRPADRRRPARRGAGHRARRSRTTRAPRWATCRSARAARSRRCRWPPPTRRSPTAAILRTPHIVRAIGGKRAPTPQGTARSSRRDRRRACARCSRACSRPGGTASEVSIPGYELAGKTGTANKIDPTTGEYSKTSYVASFVGFAPARRPAAAVAVMVDEPQGAIYGGDGRRARRSSKIVAFALPVPAASRRAERGTSGARPAP